MKQKLVGLFVLAAACTCMLVAPRAGAEAVTQRYIVVLKDGFVPMLNAESRNLAVARSVGADVVTSYTSALQGFTADLPPALAEQLRRNPAVDFVEADAIAMADAAQTAPLSWGLDRIDQRTIPLDKSYGYDSTGKGVTAYVIDSGIRLTHRDFGGRAVSGYDFIDNDDDASDCRGHGTHVAGTLGGQRYGVAKEVKLVSVRVLGCDGTGSYSKIIAGIDWVTQHADGPSVANLSLGGPSSEALNSAVRASIRAGVTYAVSAGNSSANACGQSPASTTEAITVGNAGSDDTRWYSSNFGACLDIWAPGGGIVSAGMASDNAEQTMSGTSMAAPHVAGAAARLLSVEPKLRPAAVRAKLLAAATKDIVKDAGLGSPRDLLYTGPPVPVPGPTPQPTPQPVCGPARNNEVKPVTDYTLVRSAIILQGCKGKVGKNARVSVDISHTYRGDVVVYLVAPSGAMHMLKQNNLRDNGRDIKTTFSVDLDNEDKNGTWQLRIFDAQQYDAGQLNSWSLNF